MLDGFLAKGFASKCKSLVKLTKTRIDAARRKKNSMHSFLKKDIAALLANGYDVSAYGRVEGLLSELSLLRAYDFVEQHCDNILNHLQDMQKHSECPKECQETVSSLMFSAARISDFPELRELRRIFQDKYTCTLENYVNKELAECLAHKLPATMEKKVGVMVDIAAEFSLSWDSKAFQLKISKPPTAISDPRGRRTPERRNRHHVSEKADASGRQPSNRNRKPVTVTDDETTHVTETRSVKPDGWAPPKSKDGEGESRIPDRKSPRRRHRKPGVQQEERRTGRRGDVLEEDEEEEMIDNLLQHYSHKQALYSPAQVRSSIMEEGSRKLPEDSEGNIPKESLKCEKRGPKKIPGADGEDSVDSASGNGSEVKPDKVIQKIRSNSAPREQTGYHDTKRALGHDYFSSSARHVHPKLPDYDDLAARFEAMKAK